MVDAKLKLLAIRFDERHKDTAVKRTICGSPAGHAHYEAEKNRVVVPETKKAKTEGVHMNIKLLLGGLKKSSQNSRRNQRISFEEQELKVETVV